MEKEPLLEREEKEHDFIRALEETNREEERREQENAGKQPPERHADEGNPLIGRSWSFNDKLDESLLREQRRQYQRACCVSDFVAKILGIVAILIAAILAAVQNDKAAEVLKITNITVIVLSQGILNLSHEFRKKGKRIKEVLESNRKKPILRLFDDSRDSPEWNRQQST